MDQQSNQIAIIQRQYNETNSIVLRAQGNFETLLRLPEPSNISEALEAPKINFLKKAWGEENISKCLTVFARDTARSLGFKVDGNERVVGMMVRDFIENKPFYSIEDFMLFFKLIRQRKIGSKTYGKEDWSIFYSCLEQYESDRTDQIQAINKDLNTPSLSDLPQSFVNKLADAFKIDSDQALTQKEHEEKEAAYKKAKIDYLKSERKKE